MSGKTSALDSEYIIDGVRKELTPRQILNEAAGIRTTAKPEIQPEPIVDETTDPDISSETFNPALIPSYLETVKGSCTAERDIPTFYADSCTRNVIASALLDALWRKGHFRLDDLSVSILWKWDSSLIGNMAAFYLSVEAACSYLDMLGVKISGYKFQDCRGARSIKVRVGLENCNNETETDIDDEPVDIAESIDREIIGTPDIDNSALLCEMPFKTAHPVLGRGRKCTDKVSGNQSNWLIYIPFDTCKFRLGGSTLSERTGIYGGKSPNNIDSDYFIDCYEVLREFVEDGVIVSGTTVCSGGLMAAIDRMMSDNGNSCAEASSRSEIDISAILKSYEGAGRVEVLFAEVPGVLIEISDNDFDYLDVEMVLQDVAYYPIGHPGKCGFRLSDSRTDISTILQSLIGQQDTAAEGED